MLRASQVAQTAMWRRITFALAAAAAVAASVATAQAQTVGQQMLGRLFFSAEERNVLEAVRQGLVDTSVMLANAGDIFVPEIDIPEITFTSQVIKKEGNTFSRGSQLSYQGLVRRTGADGSVSANLFLDGTLVDEDQLSTYRDEFGLNFRTDVDSGSVLEAEDKLFKSKLILSKETQIGDGEIEQARQGNRFIVLKR